MTDSYDVVVIGAGPGGYAAALYGAAAGLDIAIVEARDIGGTCLNRGCIPAKELLQTAEVHRSVQDAHEFGINAEIGSVDWAKSIQRQGQVVSRLVKGLEGLLAKRKVTVLNGWASVAGPHTVHVSGDDGDLTLDAAAIVVASGSAPATIPGFDIDGTTIMSSDQALFLDDLPASVAIIGGGVIGVEFASVFVDMGVEVLLLEALDSLLYNADSSLSKQLEGDLKKRGVDIRCGAFVNGHQPAEREGMQTVLFTHNDQDFEADVESVLVAVGRAPATADIGLAEAGVTLDERGFVEVDTKTMRSAVPGIYAVGDCVNTPALAHVGYAEAMVAIRDILGEDPLPLNYDGVPWCVYTHPEVAWCGLTEDEARERGHTVKVTKNNYAGNGRAIILGETRGFVKLVSDADSGVLLGVHLIGPWATEQLVEGYLSVNWEATVGELGFLTHPHPSLAEAIGEAALSATGRGLHG